MAKKRILVGCNVLTSIDAIAYVNHTQLWYRLGRELSEYDFYFVCPPRMSIDRMRNYAAKYSLELECDYLFFFDDDVLVPHDALQKLISRDVNIVAGVTYIRGYPFDPMIYHYVEDENLQKGDKGLYSWTDFKDADSDNGLLKCDAIGFSCVLINVNNVLKKMKPPYFVTGEGHTEDIYFCMRARLEIPTNIYCDTTVETAHIVGKYAIDSDNHEVVKMFEESMYGYKPEDKKKKDRGDAYIGKVEERLKLVDERERNDEAKLPFDDLGFEAAMRAAEGKQLL